MSLDLSCHAAASLLAVASVVASPGCVHCESVSTVEVVVQPPAAISLDTGRIHVRSVATSDVDARPVPPEPGPYRPVAVASPGKFNEHDSHYEVQWRQEDLEATAALKYRGTPAIVALTVWYDANNDSKVDVGDLVGKSSVQDVAGLRSDGATRIELQLVGQSGALDEEAPKAQPN